MNKFSPQSCCVVGNYYSLKGCHEKAVIYFRRALKLNAEFLSGLSLVDVVSWIDRYVADANAW